LPNLYIVIVAERQLAVHAGDVVPRVEQERLQVLPDNVLVLSINLIAHDNVDSVDPLEVFLPITGQRSGWNLRRGDVTCPAKNSALSVFVREVPESRPPVHLDD